MKNEQKHSTLVCTIDTSTTAAQMSADIEYAVKRARIDNPELSAKDVRMVAEHRDGQLLLYAEWTSAESLGKSKNLEDEIEDEIRKAVSERKTSLMFECDYTTEKSAAVTRVITRMYHSESGRIIYGTPMFDTHGERQTGIKVTIRYINET